MSAIDEIVRAASKLNASQFAKLRRRLDQLEKSIWEEEASAVSRKMARAKITDHDIDQMVLRRRREGRP